VFILLGLVQRGMFLDGVTYAAISNNLANGLGSFFHPHYTQTWYQEFYMQPPLVFGLQALFFKIFGNSFLVERFYSFSMALLTIWGMVLHWKLHTSNTEFKKYSWLPVLFWVVTPVVFWSYQNNMMENTLSVFSLFALYFICKGIQQKKFYWIILGSCFILCCFLAKGLVGLFPLGVVVIYFVAFRSISFLKTIGYSLLIILTFSFVLFLLVLIEDGFADNLMLYYEHQLMPSLNHEREVTTNNRLEIIGRLLMELAFPILISIVVWITRKVNKINTDSATRNAALFYLLIGVSASVPLTITFQQRGYYLVMSLSFYMLGLSIFMAPTLHQWLTRLVEKKIVVLKYVSVFLMICSLSLCVYKAGDFKRDEHRITDIHKITATVGVGNVMGCSESLHKNWGVIAYLSRKGQLSIEPFPHPYWLTEKGEVFDNSDYEELPVPLETFKLYKRKDS
jgi:hypothetical protein